MSLRSVMNPESDELDDRSNLQQRSPLAGEQKMWRESIGQRSSKVEDDAKEK